MADGKGKVKVKTKMTKVMEEELLVPADSDLLIPLKVKKEMKKEVKEEANSPTGNFKSGSVNAKKNHKSASSEKGHTHDDKSEKKQKKLYDLPGQKRDPPQERDPLRIFYETLHEQIPTSEMAEFWMMEHGLLTPEKAKKAFEKKQKKPIQLKPGSPAKPTSVKKNHQNLVKSSAKDVAKGSSKSKKKRAHQSDSDNDSDDELILPKKKLRMSS